MAAARVAILWSHCRRKIVGNDQCIELFDSSMPSSMLDETFTGKSSTLSVACQGSRYSACSTLHDVDDCGISTVTAQWKEFKGE